MTFDNFIKGKPVPGVFACLGSRDMVTMGITPEGEHFIAFYIDGISDDLAKFVEGDRLETRYYAEPPYWIGMIRLIEPSSGENYLFELHFDPYRFQCAHGHFSAELFRNDAIVTIICVECQDKRLKAIRRVKYPENFLSSIYFTYHGLDPKDGYTEGYGKFVENIQDIYESPYLLWYELCSESGSFGE